MTASLFHVSVSHLTNLTWTATGTQEIKLELELNTAVCSERKRVAQLRNKNSMWQTGSSNPILHKLIQCWEVRPRNTALIMLLTTMPQKQY